MFRVESSEDGVSDVETIWTWPVQGDSRQRLKFEPDMGTGLAWIHHHKDSRARRARPRQRRLLRCRPGNTKGGGGMHDVGPAAEGLKMGRSGGRRCGGIEGLGRETA